MKLEAQSIVKHFSGIKFFTKLSFEVNSSRIMGFLGRNGAGKTTTIRCLVDVFKQDSELFMGKKSLTLLSRLATSRGQGNEVYLDQWPFCLPEGRLERT